MSDTVMLEKREAVAIITLNRPDRANTLNRELKEALQAAALDASNDTAIRAVIVTGAGRHFCGGADLREITAATPQFATAAPSAGIALDWVPKPVIAAINGAAMGGGLEIALSCDFRFIATTAKVGLTEIRFGALPAGGGTARAPRLIGLANSKRLIMIGEPVDAAEALRMGLVDEVCEPDHLLAQALEMAKKLSERAPFAMRTAKMLLNASLEVGLDTALAFEKAMIAKMATPEEMQAARDEAAARSTTYANIFSKEGS
ncbi:enoyl-CoA hydratase/isomerase family protein [Acetobacter sacchari]|uniref:Enoyl-CoA hydratase/isomerase family protein n=1 Tax=Acetobacter sacchari TaxID=2661687 RepID=A0ABS3M0Q8_9PROT|nr:enoyl-CoA hydratase/isomerase family protein [Acetobacter sacchari]MBO1361696.1 enoyl-CoA hydratase/isomerase family protein [Acetobacter sacchari]